jgi:hypothetical protein
MKHLQTYRVFEFQQTSEFLNETEYRNLSMNYVLDKFTQVPNNGKLYHPSEEDFADLPWYQALKGAFPDFKLEGVRKKGNGYSWFFPGPKPSPMRLPSDSIHTTPQIFYDVFRPGDKDSQSEEPVKIVFENDLMTSSQTFKILLNDKESWNELFKLLYFSQFAGKISGPTWRGLKHILELFSMDLESFYKTGDLGIVGVKKDCNPYGGHYESSVDLLKNLPYGIFDDLKAGFAKKIKEDPAEIQYAISQCQLPKGTAETGFGTSRIYPENEVLNFYNLMKQEGYVPPAGFDEETGKISDLHKSLGDIGL